MGMSDKQYDGVLLNFLEDFEDIEEILPDCALAAQPGSI